MSENYFTLFELPAKIPVDKVQLTQRYQQLQRQYHPDNFATADENVRMAMLQQSANINDAYQILKDPIASAEYMLSINGYAVSHEENIIHDHQFLMEQFELREELDAIESIDDLIQQEQLLADFSEQITHRWQSAYQQLVTVIEQTNWQPALSCIDKLCFLSRLKEHIEKIEEKQLGEY